MGFFFLKNGMVVKTKYQQSADKHDTLSLFNIGSCLLRHQALVSAELHSSCYFNV